MAIDPKAEEIPRRGTCGCTPARSRALGVHRVRRPAIDNSASRDGVCSCSPLRPAVPAQPRAGRAMPTSTSSSSGTSATSRESLALQREKRLTTARSPEQEHDDDERECRAPRSFAANGVWAFNQISWGRVVFVPWNGLGFVLVVTPIVNSSGVSPPLAIEEHRTAHDAGSAAGSTAVRAPTPRAGRSRGAGLRERASASPPHDGGMSASAVSRKPMPKVQPHHPDRRDEQAHYDRRHSGRGVGHEADHHPGSAAARIHDEVDRRGSRAGCGAATPVMTACRRSPAVPPGNCVTIARFREEAEAHHARALAHRRPRWRRRYQCDQE
jgi:hypothetical protein